MLLTASGDLRDLGLMCLRIFAAYVTHNQDKVTRESQEYKALLHNMNYNDM